MALHTLDSEEARFESRRAAAHWMLNFADTSLVGLRHLDIGAGSGEMVVAAIERGAVESIGVEPYPFQCAAEDLSPGISEINRNIFLARSSRYTPKSLEVIKAAAEDLPGYDSYFDLITIFDVMEHVQDPDAVIRAAVRMLKPGGTMCVSTAPLYYSKNGHHMFYRFPESTHPWEHLKAIPDGMSKFALEEEMARGQLNKLTLGQFRSICLSQNLIARKEHIYQHHPADLELARPHIDWSIVPSEADCLTYMIQHVFSKPISATVVAPSVAPDPATDSAVERPEIAALEEVPDGPSMNAGAFEPQGTAGAE
jgi:2-polyprenyl-3-methyl-5-hydroxy-6-metoxy-1,4-benzoquinol methylase